MREIKFRVWDKETKKMFDVTHLQLDVNNAKPTFVAFDEQPAASMGYWDTFENMDEIELLQYTGLKDQNNAEIYESYIVKFDPQSPCGDEFYNPRDGEIGEVILDFGSFVVRPIDKKREDLRFSLSELGDWVVIGNIYENPELLK